MVKQWADDKDKNTDSNWVHIHSQESLNGLVNNKLKSKSGKIMNNNELNFFKRLPKLLILYYVQCVKKNWVFENSTMELQWFYWTSLLAIINNHSKKSYNVLFLRI